MTAEMVLSEARRETRDDLALPDLPISERIARNLQDITVSLGDLDSIIRTADAETVEAIENELIGSIQRRLLVVRWAAINRVDALRAQR